MIFTTPMLASSSSSPPPFTHPVRSPWLPRRCLPRCHQCRPPCVLPHEPAISHRISGPQHQRTRGPAARGMHQSPVVQFERAAIDETIARLHSSGCDKDVVDMVRRSTVVSRPPPPTLSPTPRAKDPVTRCIDARPDLALSMRHSTPMAVLAAPRDHAVPSARCALQAATDGSGTCAVLAVARAIGSTGLRFHGNVELALFGGKEQGLLGLGAYARKLKEQGANVTLMVQADMLAYHGVRSIL
jgi:hypothetical protein